MNTMTVAGFIVGTLGWLTLAALIAGNILSQVPATRGNVLAASGYGLLASTGTGALFVMGMAWAGSL